MNEKRRAPHEHACKYKAIKINDRDNMSHENCKDTRKPLFL